MTMGTKYKYTLSPILGSSDVKWRVKEYKLFGAFGVGVWLMQDYITEYTYEKALALLNELVDARKKQIKEVIVDES
jgi:hypothetical protein